jgi:isochorismate synthase
MTMSSYALYRLPHARSYTRIEQTEGEPEKLASCAALNGKRGFVIAPFAPAEGQPVVVIRGDKVSDEAFEDDGGSEADRTCCHHNPCSSHEKADNQYSGDFARFHARLLAGDFRKIVLARCAEQPLVGQLPAEQLFFRACRCYPRLFVALVHTPTTGTWLVATPETLLEGGNGQWRTIALAGTMKLEGDELGFDNPPQSLSADAIRWSQKNIQEQRYVATYLKDCLGRFAGDVHEEGPYTVRAGNLVHLRSDFTFSMPGSDRLGDLLQALHPTPAVCGLPKQEAFSFIMNNEHTPRRYYSGFMGPLDPCGDTRLYVSLRCMQIGKEICRLYAGGGLLKESCEQQEWQETEAKMETMRNLFYVQQ